MNGPEMHAAVAAQNAFHDHLGRYINGCAHTRIQKFMSMMSPRLACRARAGRVIESFRHYTGQIPATGASPLRVQLEPYRGVNPHVLAMQSYLRSRLGDDLLGACVHGSLGTGDEVKYSDFDALVILKSRVFDAPQRLAKVARRLGAARRIMLDFDVLQHHGWFVLAEDDLKYYCDAYFPRELFSHAKSLFPAMGQELELRPRDSSRETRIAFEKLIDAVIAGVERGKWPKNMFELKRLTSEIMLLPALYLQYRTGQGVYKKFSFERARQDFDPEAWKIMDRISVLRDEWEYAVSPVQRWVFRHPGALRDFLIGRAGPAIPQNIARQLTPEFFSAIRDLAHKMRASLSVT